MKEAKPIIHGGDHRPRGANGPDDPGGADPIEVGPFDSTENVGTFWGVQSVNDDDTPEAADFVLTSDGLGGSLWAPGPPRGGLTLDELILEAPCLVAFWKLNEASGDVANDSGPGNFDLDSGDDLPPTWGQPAGPPGELTAQFGSGMSQQRASFSALTGDLSAEIWVYRDDTTHGYIIGQGDPQQSNTPGWSIDIGAFNEGAFNRPKVFIGDSTGGPHGIEADAALAVDTWAHLAVVRASNVWTLYVNGTAQSATYDDSGTNYNSATGIWIGRHAGGGAGAFEGRASFAAVYNCALTADEVEEHYEAGASGTVPAEGLVLTADGLGGYEWLPVTLPAVAAEDVTVDSTTLVGTGTDAQAVFEELDNAIADHLADTTAHTAANIPFTPAGTVAATDVQAAIEEVASEAGAGGAGDGWEDDTGATWTYASASTFTVTGDRTATFSKGTRLKFTQTTVKYGVIYGSTHAAGTTTVTIIVNTDYVLANAAISANYYSYQGNPAGYPKWFNYAMTPVGFSSTSATNGYFQVITGWCFFLVTIDGTSNSTSFSFSFPTANGPAGGAIIDAFVYDNNVTQATPGNIQLTGNSATATMRKTVGGATTAWTASAGKGCYVTGAFPML